jgi:DNA mismatch repair protein MutL
MAIGLLDAATIGQIAAGEIIERPASVVKELVENALDARATRIVVRVRTGGIAEIEVSDDGDGIEATELALAVRRHATSKLSDARGLREIATLGFRGEGLASIVAVARTTIASRTAEGQVATAIDALGEDVGEPYPLAGPLGTRVLVRDLFATVPARREYLRSPAAEFARIAQWLAAMSLAYPAVGFTLEHDGRTIFAFAPDGDPRPRLVHVFGRTATGMLPISAVGAEGRIEVGGWISPPGDDRSDRRAQIVFVNGRLLRSNLFSGAWSGGYRTYAMTGRHPYGVLFVDVVPHDVDPNVHPTKSDVRLRFGERANAVAREAMQTALDAAARARLQAAISISPASAPPALDAAPNAIADVSFLPTQTADGLPPGSDCDGTPLPMWGGTPLTDGVELSARLRVLAQIDRTYILATDGRAVVLVDQHAAHERIVYEELARNATGTTRSEPLLVPFSFEVRPEEARALEGSLEDLAAGGLVIEPFGELAYRIVATPGHTTHAGKTRNFDLGHFLDVLTDDAPGLDRRHAVWASLACHSSARAGDVLQVLEMTTLIDRLLSCANPMHCPHGRPTVVRLEPEALARLFRRV